MEQIHKISKELNMDEQILQDYMQRHQYNNIHIDPTASYE